MFKTAKQLKRQYQCITFHFLESLIENQEFSGYQFYLTTSVMQTVSFNWFLSQWQKNEKCIFSKSKMSSAFFYFIDDSTMTAAIYDQKPIATFAQSSCSIV